jgi:hypothetical protein
MKITRIPEFTFEDFMEGEAPYKLIHDTKDELEREQVRIEVKDKSVGKGFDLWDDFDGLLQAYEEKMLREKIEAEEREREQRSAEWLAKMKEREADRYNEEAFKLHAEAMDARNKAKRSLKIIYVALGITIVCAVVNILCLVM